MFDLCVKSFPCKSIQVCDATISIQSDSVQAILSRYLQLMTMFLPNLGVMLQYHPFLHQWLNVRSQELWKVL